MNRNAGHVKRIDASELDEDKYHIFSYYPKNSERNFEVYQMVMEGGCDHSSTGHSSNSYEYLMLTEGEVSIIVNDREYVLEEDDGLYFDASVPPIHKPQRKNGKNGSDYSVPPLKKSKSHGIVVVCFAIFLINDIYGFVSWHKMKRRQNESI